MLGDRPRPITPPNGLVDAPARGLPLQIATWRSMEANGAGPCRPPMMSVQFSSQAELESITASRRLDGLVIRLGAEGFRSVPIIAALVTDRRLRHPIIAEVPGRQLAYDQLLQLIAVGCDVRPVLSPLGASALEEELGLLRKSAGQSAKGFVLSNLVPAIPRHLLDVFIPAIVIAGKRSGAHALATAAGLSARTIRGRLLQEGLPSPAKILGLVTGVYLSYYTGVEGLSLREAAYRSNFESEDALRLYLKCRTGILPSTWQRMGPLQGLSLAAEKLRAVRRLESARHPSLIVPSTVADRSLSQRDL